MARSLVKADIKRALREAAGDVPDPNALKPGHIQLYRAYQPLMLPGVYGIEAKQTLTSTVNNETTTVSVFNYDTSQATNLAAPDGPANPSAPIRMQMFNVVAPRFSIDPKLVNSVYPPPGFTEETRVLPHMVFNDAHLPWACMPLPPEREMFQNTPPSTHVPVPSVPNSPWFALIVFDVEELKLTAAEEQSLGIPLQQADPAPINTTPQQVKPSTGQTASPGAYQMSVKDYFSKVTSKVNYTTGIHNSEDKAQFGTVTSSTEATAVIFPKTDLVKALLLPRKQFAAMTHVRKINTTGFPDAGVQEEGMFAVAISKRTGRTAITPNTSSRPVPATQVVHLVSLECIDQTFTQPTGIADRIGLISLYSWSYLSVPPSPVNFQDIMTNLGQKRQLLLPPQVSLAKLWARTADEEDASARDAAALLFKRLSYGYTVSRWRTSVGQETVAFTRGPLTPRPMLSKPALGGGWPNASNTGKEFQILDRDLGVMDVTYSSAWQLGKLMAISDSVFNSALLRFRSLVYEWAASQTRKQVNGLLQKSELLHNIPQTVTGLHEIHDKTTAPARLILPSNEEVAPPLNHPLVAPVFARNLASIINTQTAAGEAIYSDYNLGKANNPDWEVIHRWLSDKLFLGGIPAHYLFPDPSLLPSEALRFFYIDDAWMDCFIDGALSVANHLEPTDDRIRRRIKDSYNVYLRNNIQPLSVKPPIPRYGFVLRSQLLNVMPDIRITVTCRKPSIMPPQPDESRKALVRLTKLDEFTLLALLDCYPEEIFEIVFAQPPHQQRFVAAAKLEPEPEYFLRLLYTTTAPQQGDLTKPFYKLPSPNYPSAAKMAQWYNKTLHSLQPELMLADITAALNTTNFFRFSVPDPVVLALELNDLSYQIKLTPPVVMGTVSYPKDRQLWVGNDIEAIDDPVPRIPPSLGSQPDAAIAFETSKTSTSDLDSHEKDSRTTLSQNTDRRQKGTSTQPPMLPIIAKDQVKSPITVHAVTSVTMPLSSLATPNLSAAKVGRLPKSSSRSETARLSKSLRTNSAKTAAAAAITVQSSFVLGIRPDYRGLPAQPFIAPDGTKTFSSRDFIPTGTNNLFDLIVTIKKKTGVIDNPLFPLASITVALPASTSPATPTNPPSTEPLLILPYTNPRVQMISNKRLIPNLLSTETQLQINLKPRESSSLVASVPDTIPTTLISEASFRLSQVRIAEIVNAVPVKIVNPIPDRKRSITKIQLTELYWDQANNQLASAMSEWEIVKREGGDTDSLGRPV